MEGLNVCSNCFRCFVCDVTLSAFCECEGRLYCDTHFEQIMKNAGTTCETCSNAIIGAYMDVNGHCFHQECFLCFGCRNPLGNDLYDVNGKLYCEACV